MNVARQIDMLCGDGTFVERRGEGFEAFVQFLYYRETNGLCMRVASNFGNSGTAFECRHANLIGRK